MRSERQQKLFDQMTPELQSRFMAFEARMNEEGNLFMLREVLRTPEIQRAYHAQGRQPLALVNALRKAAGLSPIGDKENSYCVTWTLVSRHFAGADGLARAFDIVLLKNGQPTWDTKWDSNDGDLVPEYIEAARIGQMVGLDAGGLWVRNPDYPHFQLRV